MIFLLELQEFNEGSRRSFNQQQVLLECILAEVKMNNPEIYQAYNEGNTDVMGEVHVEVTGMGYPWNTVDSLKSVFLSDPTSKSRDKYVSIVEALFSHAFFRNHPFDLKAVFALTATHVLTAYPASKPTALPGKRTPLPLRLPRAAAKPVLTQLITLATQPVAHLLPQRESARSFAAHLPNGTDEPDGFDDALFDCLLDDDQLGDHTWANFHDEWDAADLPLQSISSAIGAGSIGKTVTDRPTHPLPLSGAGHTAAGEPLVNVCHTSLSSFRSLAYTSAESLTVTQTLSNREAVSSFPSRFNSTRCTPAFDHSEPLMPTLPDKPRSSAFPERVSADVLPFPVKSDHGFYSRRTTFSPISFSVLSLEDPPLPLEVRRVSLDVDDVRARADSEAALVWMRESSSETSESFEDARVPCCTADSLAPLSTVTPTQFKEIDRPAEYWDSGPLDFDFLDEALESDTDLSAEVLGDLFCPIGLVPVLQVCRPTPKRPFAALGLHGHASSTPTKKRATVL